MNMSGRINLFKQVIFENPNETNNILSFEESTKSDVNKAESDLAIVVEHLYKLSYCDNEIYYQRDRIGWETSVETHQKRVRNIVDLWVILKRMIIKKMIKIKRLILI
jgi:hypothetical protein